MHETDKNGTPYPPAEILDDNVTERELVARENAPIFFIDRFEYPTPEKPITIAGKSRTTGIYIYKYGAKIEDRNGRQYVSNLVRLAYPERGFPTPEAVGAVNQMKRFAVCLLNTLGQREMILCMSLLFFLPYKRKIRVIERFLNGYQALGSRVLQPYFLKDERLSDSCSELRKFLKLFLINIGISEYEAGVSSRVFAHLIEYDSAYRYRMEDILNETNSVKLILNPRKEIKNLLEVLKRRDQRIGLIRKVENLVNLFSLLLLVPGIKKAFIKAIKQVDFTKMQLDEIDKYHALRLDSYDFMGLSIEVRNRAYMKIHNNNPPQSIMVR